MKKGGLKKELTGLIRAELDDIGQLAGELKRCKGRGGRAERHRGSEVFTQVKEAIG